MKKSLKIFSLILAVLLILPVLTACNKKEGIEINTPFKTTYEVGETLNVAGGIIDYTDKEGNTIQVAVKSTMVSGFTTETVGERNMVITYKDYTTTVKYVVEPENWVIGGVYVAPSQGQYGTVYTFVIMYKDKLYGNTVENEISTYNDAQLIALALSGDEQWETEFEVEIENGIRSATLVDPASGMTVEFTNITKNSFSMIARDDYNHTNTANLTYTGRIINID